MTFCKSNGRPLEDFDYGPSPTSPIHFSFAHGGAGICITRTSIQQLEDNYQLITRFKDLAFNIGLNDDVTLGYIMEIVLKLRLTPVKDFHSHSEQLRLVKLSDLESLVTASYKLDKENLSKSNILSIGQDLKSDPTAFFLLHDMLK